MTDRRPALSRASVSYLLAQLGLRGQLHPDDVFAYIHPDQDSFDHSARINREGHHNDVRGPYQVGGVLIQLVDVTPQLRKVEAPVTDPGRPDRFTDPCCPKHARTCRTPSRRCCPSCTEADHPGHQVLGPCAAPPARRKTRR